MDDGGKNDKIIQINCIQKNFIEFYAFAYSAIE